MKKIILLFATAFFLYSRSDAQFTAQVIHNSADPTLDSVDVYLLGTEALANLQFRSEDYFSLTLPVSPFPARINVTPGGQPLQDSVYGESAVLQNSEHFLAVAAGVIDTSNFAPNPDNLSTALTIDTLQNAPISSLAPGTVSLTLFNGVTDAPALDVFVPGLGPVIFGLQYGHFAAVPFPAPVGVYELQLRSAADTSQIYGTFVADLSNFGGEAVVGFASGFLNPAANQNGAALGLFGAVADSSDSVVEFPALPTGVKTIGRNLGALNLYPSPATNLLNYKYTVTSSTDISVDVFNNAGALVYNRHFGTQTPGKYEESLDVSKFAAGIYTVKIGDTKNTSTSSFVKK
jgi:hypothetical protein